VSNGHTWPTALDWVHSSFPADEYERPLDFVTDEESFNKLELLAFGEARKKRREEIWVTAEGRLRGPQRYIRPGVKAGVGGYGHLGICAAQFVVKRVVDVEIKPQPTFDYGEMLGPHL